MSLLNLGVFPFLLGLGLLAGLLYILQRLRVRFSEKEVVTTLFWKQAIEETRSRVLIRRFRHPLAYLLALAIAGLLWLAFAEPGWNHSKEGHTIFLLDGSAGMGWGNRFDQAKRLLLKEADRIPAARRRVYFCGADARLVLDQGEETCLLMPRLEKLTPEACPSAIERELFALVTGEAQGKGLKVLVVGDAPVSEACVDKLRDHAVIERLRSEKTPKLQDNTGIAAIGVADAASGVFNRVDVMIEVAGSPDTGLSFFLGGKIVEQAPVKRGQVYYLRDLPASGEVLEVTLVEEDSLAMDNRVRITLPVRRTVAVEVDENLDDSFGMLVEADPALTRSSGQAQVVIGGMADGALPAIELVTGNGIAVIYEDGLSPAAIDQLQNRFSKTGLDRVGWTSSLDSDQDGSFQLSPRYVPGPKRKVQIGIELLGKNFDFMQTSAFPLFVSSAIRWLADVEDISPFAIAGERLTNAGRFSFAGSDYAPPRAGRYLDQNGKPVEVSLSAVQLPESDALKQVTRSNGLRRWPSPVTACLLFVLFLVGAEWLLYQKGRIP